MDQVQMIALLNSIEDVPVYYGYCDPATPLPHIVVSVDQGRNFGADNCVYVQGWDFTVDLYTKSKDAGLEATVKSVLNNAGVYWSRSESYYSDEACYEIEFTFSVWGDETNPIPDPTPDPTPEPEEDGEDNGTDDEANPIPDGDE